MTQDAIDTGLVRVVRPWRGPSKPAIAAIAFGLGAIVGLNLTPSARVVEDTRLASPAAIPMATSAPTPRPVIRATPGPPMDGGGPVTGLEVRFMDGIRFSFVAGGGWANFGPAYPNHITQSTHGPQGAEGVIFWTAYPKSDYAAPCEKLFRSRDGISAANLIDIAAAASGIDVVSEPGAATVGGRPATNVALRVRKDDGCDPGYFFLWPWVEGGPLWSATENRDSIELWAIDLQDRLFVIESITKPDGGAALIEQIHGIVDSFKFYDVP